MVFLDDGELSEDDIDRARRRGPKVFKFRMFRKRESIVLLAADLRLRVGGEGPKAWWRDSLGIHHDPFDSANKLPNSHFREGRRIGREILGNRRFNNLNTAPDEADLLDRADDEE